MLLKKLARAIACKHCENPSKLYELQIHADEQAREILRLNHVLDEIKKERDAARQAADEQQLLCEDAIESLAVISEKNCDNCGKKCRVKPKPGEPNRYNCHLWQEEPEGLIVKNPNRRKKNMKITLDLPDGTICGFFCGVEHTGSGLQLASYQLRRSGRWENDQAAEGTP